MTWPWTSCQERLTPATDYIAENCLSTTKTVTRPDLGWEDPHGMGGGRRQENHKTVAPVLATETEGLN